MKIFKSCLIMTLLAASTLALSAPREARAAAQMMESSSESEGSVESIHKIEAGIGEDRDKIIAESKAVKEDRRKIRDAGKLSDKAKADQIKTEAAQDIAKREVVIKELKRSINAKKDERGRLLYGKGQAIETRTVGR